MLWKRGNDLTTFIDEGSEIEGKYTFSGTVLLNGRFREATPRISPREYSPAVRNAWRQFRTRRATERFVDSDTFVHSR